MGILVVLAIGAGVGLAKRESLDWKFQEIRGWFLDLSAPKSDTLPTPLPATGIAVSAVEGTEQNNVQPRFEATATEAPTQPTPTAAPTVLPTATSIPIKQPPQSITLTPPKWEKQGINNCGPTTLAMYMRYYGWQGTQDDVAAIVHPNTLDKNVRWDELVYYVKTHAGWLDALFRVGGTVPEMKTFLANGFPVIIETGYELPDFGWVGHYLLLTGYDDAQQVFIVQDATAGPDQKVPYDKIDEYWQQFNRLYILVYMPDKADTINAILGPDADEAKNRQDALAAAQADVKAAPDDPFAYFNLGSNLNYFDRYTEAAAAFDKARDLGLPKRMLFYQFGPYRAYFNLARYQDVIDLSTFTLDYRPDLEESYFWRGWAEYELGKHNDGIADWHKALEVNPTFLDAQTALQSVGAAP